MNWLTMLQSLFKLVPYVVAGIEVIHTNETTETKTQLAQDALSIATQAAAQILSPGNAAISNSVSAAVNNGIQNVQDVLTAIKANKTAPITVAIPAVQNAAILNSVPLHSTIIK
jgi:translation initiation factor 2 alpha subunit (eIF-2alpha)